MNDKTIIELGFRIIWRIASTDNTLHDLHNYWVGGTKFLLSVLCIIECPVQLISEVFWDCISVDTRLPRFEALAYVLPHFDALTRMVIRVSSAFIFQTFAEVYYSVFVKRSPFKCLLNLRKAYIFQEFAEGLLSICVCWIFQNVHLSKVSAAVVPQSKSTELCSSAAVVPQSKSTEMLSSAAAPFHHDLWYFWHRTNEHFGSMLFIRKNL